jgi:hypothetical protein
MRNVARTRDGRVAWIPIERMRKPRRTRDPVAVVIGVAVLAGLSVVWLLTK